MNLALLFLAKAVADLVRFHHWHVPFASPTVALSVMGAMENIAFITNCGFSRFEVRNHSHFYQRHVSDF